MTKTFINQKLIGKNESFFPCFLCSLNLTHNYSYLCLKAGSCSLVSHDAQVDGGVSVLLYGGQQRRAVRVSDLTGV